MDHGQPGSSVHGILQARILEWVAINLLMWYRSRFLFFCFYKWMSSFSKIIWWKDYSFLLNCIWSFIENRFTVYSWVYFWALYWVQLIAMLILWSVSHCFVLYLHRSLEVREHVSFNFVLFHNCLWKFIFLCKFKNHVVDIYRITCNWCPVLECWSYMFLLECMLREWCVRVIWEWGFWSYDVKSSSIRYFH